MTVTYRCIIKHIFGQTFYRTYVMFGNDNSMIRKNIKKYHNFPLKPLGMQSKPGTGTPTTLHMTPMTLQAYAHIS